MVESYVTASAAFTVRDGAVLGLFAVVILGMLLIKVVSITLLVAAVVGFVSHGVRFVSAVPFDGPSESVLVGYYLVLLVLVVP